MERPCLFCNIVDCKLTLFSDARSQISNRRWLGILCRRHWISTTDISHTLFVQTIQIRLQREPWESCRQNSCRSCTKSYTYSFCSILFHGTSIGSSAIRIQLWRNQMKMLLDFLPIHWFQHLHLLQWSWIHRLLHRQLLVKLYLGCVASSSWLAKLFTWVTFYMRSLTCSPLQHLGIVV